MKEPEFSGVPSHGLKWGNKTYKIKRSVSFKRDEKKCAILIKLIQVMCILVTCEMCLHC